MNEPMLTTEELLRERRYVEAVPSVFRTSQERFRLRLLDEHAELTRRVRELEDRFATVTKSRDKALAKAEARIAELEEDLQEARLEGVRK